MRSYGLNEFANKELSAVFCANVCLFEIRTSLFISPAFDTKELMDLQDFIVFNQTSL